MTILQTLSYYWSVIKRAFSDTLAFVIDQKLVSLTILFLIGLVVYLAAKARFPSLLKEWGEPMDKAIEFAIFSLVSVVVYAAFLFVVYIIASPAAMHYEQAAEIKALKPPDGLDLYYQPFLSSGVSGNGGELQWTGVTVTNRSKRNMNLHFSAHLYYATDKGEKHRLTLPAEWDSRGKLLSGGEWLTLQSESTFVGNLSVYVPEPQKYGLSAWHIDPTQDVVFMVKDTITGAEVYFRYDYPAGRLAELPGAEKTMAQLSFQVQLTNQPEKPKETKTAPGNPPADPSNRALEPLNLLLRTRGHMYNAKGVVVPAAITNNSDKRMRLQINLLSRKSVDDKEWRNFRGVIAPSREKNKDHLDYYALDFGPGDTADCNLVFANTGFSNKAGENLDESPGVSLLQVYDEVSRKKVWCAIKPGYPPGAVMPSAAIQAPSPIPQSDSDNTQKDETKDTK